MAPFAKNQQQTYLLDAQYQVDAKQYYGLWAGVGRSYPF